MKRKPKNAVKPIGTPWLDDCDYRKAMSDFKRYEQEEKKAVDRQRVALAEADAAVTKFVPANNRILTLAIEAGLGNHVRDAIVWAARFEQPAGSAANHLEMIGRWVTPMVWVGVNFLHWDCTRFGQREPGVYALRFGVCVADVWSCKSHCSRDHMAGGKLSHLVSGDVERFRTVVEQAAEGVTEVSGVLDAWGGWDFISIAVAVRVHVTLADAHENGLVRADGWRHYDVIPPDGWE